MMLHGCCLCGAVEFQAEPARGVILCHCGQCRAQSGHVWAATSAPLSAFRLIREDGLRWYEASPAARRGFCGRCGAFLFWKPAGEDRISIAAGALDGETGLSVAESWHNADAGDYHDPAGGPPPRPLADPAQLHGACLCGENRFSLPGPMGAVTACHCRQCRKTSGHHSASFDAQEHQIIWHARHLAEHVGPGGGRRAFCPTCGTKLMFCGADGALSVECGAIARPTGGHLARHICVADKGDYYALTDGLPQRTGA